jgi:omega-6 fatty acid desaturase (delta-12 desaturase)
MTEASFNWRMLKAVVTHCHVHDEEHNYVPFDAGQPQEDKFLKLQRRFWPSV